MTLKYRNLDILIAGRHAGNLTIDNDGKLSFQYHKQYTGTPLSTNIPITRKKMSGKTIYHWFSGILPDNPDVRESMASEKDYGRDSVFGLLSDYGMDLPGAIQAIPANQKTSTQEAYRPISHNDIATRLDKQIGAVKAGKPVSWTDLKERWSLAGYQPKIALMKKEGQYYSCEGRAASNIIVKPGIVPDSRSGGYPYQSLSECLALNTLEEAGIPVAHATMETFGRHQSIIVERFDRFQKDDGTIGRVHQEDLGQALGISSFRAESKYEVTSGMVLRHLEEVADPASRNRFVDALITANLLGHSDGHAKNYSLLFSSDGRISLAPLYDVATDYPYILEGGRVRTAMRIGDSRISGLVTARDLAELADSAHLNRGMVVQRATELADILPGAACKAVERNEHAEGIDYLARTYLTQVKDKALEITRKVRPRLYLYTGASTSSVQPRNPDGTFGFKTHTAPNITLPSTPTVTVEETLSRIYGEQKS